jgi:iron complex outermembrane recepter protein
MKTKIQYLYSLLLCCCSFSLAAQSSLSGKVTDKSTHEPLEGVVLYIHELNVGTLTDKEGTYSFKRLPKGNFLLEAHLVSYGNRIILLNLEKDSLLDIEMETSITELHHVVVTGVSAATENRLNPLPVISMDKKQLQEQNSTNLIDAISRQPGVAPLSSGPAISKPVIRGMGYNRVVTLYNGMRQEGQQWGDEHGIELDEYSVEKAEIIKGPGSIMYGPDALAGVLNFITISPVPEGRITGNLMTTYQNNNGLIGYSLLNAGNLKGISWRLRYSEKHAGSYHNAYDGYVYNSAFKEKDFSGFLGINRKWGFSQLHLTSFDQTIGMIEGERDSNGNFTRMINEDSSVTASAAELNSYSIHTPYQRVRHHRILLNNQFFIGKSRLTVSASYQLNRRQEFGDPLAHSDYSLYFYLPTLTYDLKYFFPERNGWKHSVGFSGMYQQNKNKGIEFLIPSYSLNDNGFFVFSQKTINSRLGLSGGARYDIRRLNSEELWLDSLDQPAADGDLKFAALDKVYHNLAFSAGLTYKFNEKLLLKLNVARGFRPPNMAELASNGRHEGTLRYEHGNASLKAETSLQFDAGTEWNTEHVSLSIGLFSNHISHYIYAVRLRSAAGGDSIADPSERAPSYQFGQGKAWLYGGEIVLDIHPHPLDWLHFENSFSMVRAENPGQSDSSRHLPFIPAPRLLSELRANFKKAGPWLRQPFVRLNLEHNFEQSQYLKENGTETSTPAYTLIHAGMGADIGNSKGKKYFSLLIGINNIFDVAYQSHLSRLKYAAINPATGRTGVFNMGRNLSLKLIVPIGS